jgi:hypothetical protein
MKPSIDMRLPTCANMKHLQVNAKRIMVEAERNASIDRENKILLGKMYTIMNAEPAYVADNSWSVTSLNMIVRKQEYDRIARENQAIMQRILHRESNFNRADLDADWVVTQRYLHNISGYPFILGGSAAGGHSPSASRPASRKGPVSRPTSRGKGALEPLQRPSTSPTGLTAASSVGAHVALLHDAPAPAPAPTPNEPVDAADFDTGGRRGAQKPPTVYTTDPEMELVPIPRPKPAPATAPAPEPATFAPAPAPASAAAATSGSRERFERDAVVRRLPRRTGRGGARGSTIWGGGLG